MAVTLALVTACTGSAGGSGADGARGTGVGEPPRPDRVGVSAEERVGAVVDAYLEGDLTGAREDVRAVW